MKDICSEATARGRLDERSERAHVAVALGAAVIGQPHKTAMGVLDAAGSMLIVRTNDGHRQFVQVKGSGGDLYNTYGGYCSCKYSEKHAERNGFFKVSVGWLCLSGEQYCILCSSCSICA